MGGIINLGGFHTVIPVLDYNPTFFLNGGIIGDNQSFVYIKVSETNREKHKSNFMKYIGGQDNSFVGFINLPSYHQQKRRSFVDGVRKISLHIMISTVEYVCANHVQRMFQIYIYTFVGAIKTPEIE